MRMKLSEEECRGKHLTEESLHDAVARVKEVGFVVLEDVLPGLRVRKMRELLEEHTAVQAVPEDGRGGIPIPLDDIFLDDLAVQNPFALPIVESIMGNDIWSIFPYHTNTTWPGAGIQHIHRDTQHLFPELPYALPPSLLIVHIPLVDFTEENGSTEVWPGSHLVIDPTPESTKPEALSRRAAQMPSVRTNMSAGSVVVRDMRVWHRGMPNVSDTIRTMLSIVYFRQFHRYPDHLVHLEEVSAPVLEKLPERAREIYRYHPVSQNSRLP